MAQWRHMTSKDGTKCVIFPLLLAALLALGPYLGSILVTAFAPPAGSVEATVAPGRCRIQRSKNQFAAVPIASAVEGSRTKRSAIVARGAFRPPSVLNALPANPASSLDSSPFGRMLCVVSGASILAFYHIRQYVLDRSGKSKSWCSHQADVREKWSRHVRDSEGWLYAVQTLRNAITTNTFLATTVITLLTLISGKIWDILRNTPVSSPDRSLLVIKFASVALCMMASAYHFLQSARLMTHAGFMFPASPRKTLADAIMRRSQITQWLGLRWLYISLSAISWTVGGDRTFLASSLALVLFFRNIDRVPVGVDGVKDAG